MKKKEKDPGLPLPVTLRVQPAQNGTYEVRDQDGKLLGFSQTEMLAVWTAVTAAEEISKSGVEAKVVSRRNGQDVEEFVARAPFRLD